MPASEINQVTDLLWGPVSSLVIDLVLVVEPPMYTSEDERMQKSPRPPLVSASRGHGQRHSKFLMNSERPPLCVPLLSGLALLHHILEQRQGRNG